MKKLIGRLRLLAFAAALVTLIAVGFNAASGWRDALPTESPVSDTRFPTVILDPGHGGMDGGCVAVNGVAEKGINLAIALEVRDILTAMGYDVVMTRDKDISIYDSGTEGVGKQKKSDMENRLKLINSYDNAVAVSIHQNQFTDSQYSGAQMFYSASDPQSEKLADIMQKKFVSNIQPGNTRETKQIGDDLYLLYYSNCPMIMSECGFLSNPEESEKLQNEIYQKQVAFTIAGGIIDFINQQ